MGERIIFDTGNVDPVTGRDSTAERVQALMEWARMQERRMAEMQGGMLNLIGNIEGLVDLLATGQTVTYEEIENRRLLFLKKVAEIQAAAAKEPPKIWTPRT